MCFKINTGKPNNYSMCMPKICPGSIHIVSSENKDTRWFSFWDHASAWDQRWHSEQLVHAYAYFLDAKSPWNLQPYDPDTAGEPTDTMGLRNTAWNVT